MPRRSDDDDDDAPWLAGVAEERGRTTSVSRRGLGIGIAVFLVLLAAIVGGIYAVTSRPREEGSAVARVDPEALPLIPADEGPYKVRPIDPGGMQVDGAGDAMHATASGVDPGGDIDPYAVPEEPVTRPGESGPRDLLPPTDGASVQGAIPPVEAPARAPLVVSPPKPAVVKPVIVVPKPVVVAAKPVPVIAPKPPVAKPIVPVAKPEAKPAPATVSSGPASLQLGAFSTREKAETAWTAAKDRFPAVAGLTKRIDAVDRDGSKLYRLRATGVENRAAATDLCARLRVAGAVCLVAE